MNEAHYFLHMDRGGWSLGLSADASSQGLCSPNDSVLSASHGKSGIAHCLV